MTPDTSDPSLIRNSWDDPEFTEQRVREAIVRLERGQCDDPDVHWRYAEAAEQRDDLRAEVERLRATVDYVKALADAPGFTEAGAPVVCADRLNAALAGGVAADAPTSSDGGA